MRTLLFFTLLYLTVPVNSALAQDIPQRVGELEKQVAALNEVLHKLTTRADENAVPVGTIVAFGGPESQLPDGWLHCNGMPYDVSRYPKLAEALAKAWGGNSSGTKFNVPDLRGQFLRGWDENADIDPNKLSRKSKNGSKNGNNVGSYQEDATALPNAEFIGNAETAGRHSHKWGGPGWGAADKYDSGHGRTDGNTPKNPWPTSQEGEHEHRVKITGGGDTETRPTNACVLYIIKAE